MTRKEPPRREVNMDDISSAHMYYDVHDGKIEADPSTIVLNHRGGSFYFIPKVQFLELQGDTVGARKEQRNKWAETRNWKPELDDVLSGWHEFLNRESATVRHPELTCDTVEGCKANTWGMTVYDYDGHRHTLVLCASGHVEIL